jgi:hypothetical protein
MANLITLEEYKIHEGVENLTANARLEDIINSVSQLVKTYCANSFVDFYGSANNKTEYFNLQFATSVIQLSESPLVSITSVEERTSYGSPYVALSDTAFEYYVDMESDSIYRTSSSGYSYWAQGPGSVRVIYEAGYAEIPADLKLAVIDLINYYFKDEYKERRTIGGTSITNQVSSTQWRNVDFPDHIKRVLDLYKQIQI